MEIKKTIFLSFLASLITISASATENKYTNAEIYEQMCSNCHGVNGEGNPAKKGPALNDMTAHEIESELYAIQNEGMNQSSGTNHEVMEHNQAKIEKKGMKYDPKEMAKYIEGHFYNK
jgi:cytochrome c553